MEIHNNNRAVEKELATAYYKKDRRKNTIMSIAIGMSVLLLYAAFSIADGKVRSDYLTDIRGMGTTANVSLQNGSKKQYEQMQKLSYLDAVGIEKDAMNVYTADGIRQELVYVDDTAFDKMLAPAYTDICGEYPENVDEIMASETVLEQYGITDPKIGQDVDMELEMPDGTKVKRQFKVSGFYRDYIDISINVPKIYVSEAFLQESDISLFPADKIIARQGTVESGAQIEQWVYSDIDMEYDSQQVYGENPMIMQKINGTFGSLPVAVSCVVIVVLCAFMLIYNVSSIAMARDIRQYGMLKVIGTTNRQIKRIAFRNNMKNTLRGICVGAAVGGIAVKIFVPYVLQVLYMRGLGKSDVTGFYAGYMIFSAFIVFITSFIAESAAVRQVTKKSAIEAIHFYSLEASANPKFDYLDQQNIQDYGKGSLNCCGYLDFTDENFPKLQTTSMGNNINYFIMTKKAFNKLGFSEKTFDISFNSVKNKDTGINQKLSQIVQNENEKSADMDTYYLNANYQLLDSEQSRIKVARLMLGALAFVISMIGIMNYANTLISEYASRKCEFAVMQSIGLDRRQLWKMVFLEGCFYSIIAIIGLILAGSPAICGLGAAIRKKLVYFKFIYPWKLLIVLSIMLFIINLIIAVVMYRKSQDFAKIRGNYE